MPLKISRIKVYEVNFDLVVAPKELSTTGVLKWYSHKYGADVVESDVELLSLTKQVETSTGEFVELHQLVKSKDLTDSDLPAVIV